MASNKDLLLVHSNMENTTVSEATNIMLTPQLYTLKKEELPIKYLYQAKRIAPSLFDGLLDGSKEYDYFVYKEDEKWVYIAYSFEQIKDLLISKDIKPEKVSKIFFAQQAYASFSSAVYIGEKEALINLDDTVVVVPRVSLEKGAEVKAFDQSFAPKNGVGMQGIYSADSFIERKQAVTLAIVFSIFAGMFFVEGLRNGGNSKNVQEEMDTLLEKYPTLQSQYTRESIFDKYKTIDKNERKKREVLKSFSRMIFKGVTLTSLTLNEKAFKAEFSCSDKKVYDQLVKLAKKEKRKVLDGKDAKSMSIEGLL